MKKFFQNFFSLIFFLAILLNNFQPFFYLSFFKKTFASDNLKVDINFNFQNNKFKIEINNSDANVSGKLNYLLAYQTDKQTEAVQGTEVELNKKENFLKEIYAGTCSKDTCTPHKVLRGILKTEINEINWLKSQLFEIKEGNLVLGEERDVMQLELTEEENYWLNYGQKLIPTIKNTPTLIPEISVSSVSIDKKESEATPTEIISTSTPAVLSEVSEVNKNSQEKVGTVKAVVIPVGEDPGYYVNPYLLTDKPDYSPTDTVVIAGKGFAPNTFYILDVYSLDYSFSLVKDVLTDNNGDFVYSFQLDGVYRPNYEAEIRDKDGVVITKTSFTDGTPHLEVSLTGNGSGTVTSADGHINCNINEGNITGTCSYTYNGNFSTTLTANPSLNSAFNGWSGGCTGSQATCTASANGNNTFSVTVNFTLIPTSIPTLTSTPIPKQSPTSTPTSTPTNTPTPTATPTSTLTPTSTPTPSPTISPLSCVNDSAGANDEPGQKDLTRLCRNLSQINPLEINWNWDETSMSGANIADACALFDTDNDGLANYSLCVTWDDNQHQVSGSPTLYSCNDTRADRCAQAVLITNSISSTCNVGNATDDPFPAGDNHPNDTKAQCLIDLNDIGGPTSAYLLDVCSYPSTQPNSDPSDCVIIRTDKGNLTIIKDVSPDDPNTNWDFAVSGPTSYNISISGDGQSSSPVDLGSYSITETAGTNTNLSNYTTSWSCLKNGNAYLNGTGTTISNIVIGKTGNVEDSVICTFTNTLKKGKLKIVKNALGGDATFDFQIKDSQDITVATRSATTSGGIGDTGFINLPPGTYKIREMFLDGWYSPESSDPPYCLDDSQNQVGSFDTKTHQITLTLNNNDEITCYFKNIKYGKLIIDKVTNPSADPQTFDFDFYREGNYVKTVENLTDQSNPYETRIFADVWEIVEKPVNGWKLTDITCNDPDQGSSIDLTNNKARVDIDPGETVSCTFTNSKYGSILVHKFNDRDGDGVKDSDDWVLGGWQMKLFSGFNCQGDPIDQGVTNTSGNKLFSNLLAGQYSVLEVITPWEDGRDWVNTTGGVCQNVTLNAGQQANVVFGNYLEGFIKICKVNDLNGNGVYEVGEPFITDWTMYLQTPTGQILSGVTGNDGCYTFGDLSPGNYYLSEEERTGWIRTNPTDPRFYPILFTIASGGGFVSKIYNFQLGKISGYKFEDLDGDGIKDSNETGLSGWVIELDKDTDGIVDKTVTTNDNGYYEFTGLTAGTYRVREQEQEGWQQTTANPSDITIQSGTVVKNVNFGNFELGIIQGRKFNDLNANGNRDAGEPYFNDWTIRLYKKNGSNWNLIDSKLTGHTGTAGQYKFKDLTLGQYKICEVLQTGWGQTSPTGNPNNVTPDEAPRCRTTSIDQSGQSRTGQSFGNVQLGSISGTKYEDLNGDGDRGYEQGSEPGLENWTIELYNTQGNKIKSFTTDSKGDYWFEDLLPGDYKVCEVLQNGWINTEPGDGSVCYDINLKPGENLTGISFGNFELGKITVTKFHDRNQNGIKDNDEEPLSDWIINLASDSGSLSKITTNSGEVIFDNLLWGDYFLSENQLTDWELTNIYCDSYQGNYDNNSYLLKITSGANLSCYVGNYQQPIATLSKSNNSYPNSITPGSIVTFTLKLKVEGNNLNNVIIRDILPPNFTFNNVWSATLNGNPITLANPNYASPGTWNLGDLKEGDEVVINYQAKANTSIDPGLYKDLAWAVGNETESETSDKILAKAVDSGNTYDSGVVSENFVGTKVVITKDNQNYTNIDIKKEEIKEEEGEVLGATTSLPATGGKAIWLILASFFVILGGLLINMGLKNKTFKKILNLILATGLYLLIANHALAGSLSVRLSEPQSPTRFNNFKLNFVALDLNNNPITVKCFYKKEGGVYTQFDTDKNLTAGGNIGSCQVTSSQINEEGKTYSFYVSATNGIETINSEIVSVDYKTKTPGTPTNYSKEKSSSCEYKIKFKTADDSGLTKKVEIYRSRETSFSLDGSSRTTVIPIGSNTDYTYTDSLPSGYCNDVWYYVVRAFDDAGNGSGWVGDAIITIVTKTTTSSTAITAETLTPTTGAIVVTGVTLPPAQTTETPEVLGEKTATPEISPSKVVEKKKIKSIGEILGETVKRENKNKLIIIAFGVLILGIIGYVYKKKKE